MPSSLKRTAWELLRVARTAHPSLAARIRAIAFDAQTNIERKARCQPLSLPLLVSSRSDGSADITIASFPTFSKQSMQPTDTRDGSETISLRRRNNE